MREVNLSEDRECENCGIHSEWHKEIYNHATGLSPLVVCERCHCGFEVHEVEVVA